MPNLSLGRLGEFLYGRLIPSFWIHLNHYIIKKMNVLNRLITVNFHGEDS